MEELNSVYRDGITTKIDRPVKVFKTRDGHTVERFTLNRKHTYFVTLKGTHWCAHGTTVAEAVADAYWKNPETRPSIEAVVSRVKKRGKTKKITLNEFRTITGACREGCRQALEKAGLSGTTAMTAFDIRDKVSAEWGEKLLSILGWTDK